MIQQRNFWKVFLLSLITCNIYMYYYIYTTTRDMNTISGENKIEPSLAVILSIVTCGIYSYFWYYDYGNTIQNIAHANNIYVNENGTTYLLWSILGVFIGIGPLIALYLFISNFNKISVAYNCAINNNQY